jgi:SAM-dependent methyltransferase
MTIKCDIVQFDDRGDRARYVAATLSEHFAGRRRVLDVGCDRKLLLELLREHIPEVDYTGIDIGGTPDLVINLDETPRLPLADASFDLVICTDVLEHLEHLHRTFDEIVRVMAGGGRAIISLPNCWNNLRGRIRRGHGTPRYYGLPGAPPEDRHRWFFNVEDVAHFMAAQCRRHPIRIVSMHANENPRTLGQRLFEHVMYPWPRRYLNRYAHSVWTVLEKASRP